MLVSEKRFERSIIARVMYKKQADMGGRVTTLHQIMIKVVHMLLLLVYNNYTDMSLFSHFRLSRNIDIHSPIIESGWEQNCFLLRLKPGIFWVFLWLFDGFKMNERIETQIFVEKSH